MKPGDVVGCLLGPGEDVPKELLALVAAQLARPETKKAQVAASARGNAASSQPPAPPDASGPPVDRPLRVTPIARRIAAENGIDLSQVTGSGPEGRITEQDVRRAIESRASATGPAAPAVEAPRPARSMPYRGRRRTIGERMLQSLQTMAQLTVSTEVAVDDALRMVHGLNREWRRDGVVVTLTALVVRACGLALREHPQLNSRLEGDEIEILPDVHVGVAVDLPDGLMAPVVRASDRTSLKEVAGAVVDLSARAKDGKLKVDDLTGATFTVTSLESFGVDVFTPIVNPPQAAILGVGRVREVAAFEGNEVVRRQVTTLNLSFDHRVVDGAPAARFLARVAELLDRPYLLM